MFSQGQADVGQWLTERLLCQSLCLHGKCTATYCSYLGLGHVFLLAHVIHVAFLANAPLGDTQSLWIEFVQLHLL